MRLRPLRLADLDAVLDLDQLCFPPNVAFPREAFLYWLSNPDCIALGHQHWRKLIAFAILYFPGPRAGQIITIDVHPDHRRHGLADAMMRELSAKALDRGATRLVLQVAPDNLPAQTLYQKWGFAVKATLPNYYGPSLDALLMDKFLDETRQF